MAESAAPTAVGPILLCTDGSEAALEALRAGLDVIDRQASLVLVTVTPEPDIMAVTGTGMAGGTLTPEAFDQEVAQTRDHARRLLDEVLADLGLGAAETRVLEGDAGPVICALAEELSAKAIVMGTRGRGGLRRAVLGSVSDHVVRRAPCTVIVSRDGLGDD